MRSNSQPSQPYVNEIKPLSTVNGKVDYMAWDDSTVDLFLFIGGKEDDGSGSTRAVLDEFKF